MKEKFERQLPIGIGGEKLKAGRETLPAVEVKNTVLWVNRNLELPFDLKTAKSNPLGMFFASSLGAKETEKDETTKTYNLEVDQGHQRSGILGRVIFKDKAGRLYRDIDLKGIGYLRHQNLKNQEPKPAPEYEFIPKTWGILNLEFARRDIKMAKKFLELGIRTHQPVALIELDEIIDKDGQKITIDEAKKRGLLKNDDYPVVEVRAWGTRSRVIDFVLGPPEERKKILNDTMSLVSQELGKEPGSFSTEDYLKWFIETTATNLARMHARNLLHGFFGWSQHNHGCPDC